MPICRFIIFENFHRMPFPLQWASKKFRSLTALIDHEQINMEDRFGQVMLDNLNQRGCALIGASTCKNKDTQVHLKALSCRLSFIKGLGPRFFRADSRAVLAVNNAVQLPYPLL